MGVEKADGLHTSKLVAKGIETDSRVLFVKLPVEAQNARDESTCSRIRNAIYGARDAKS